MDSPPYRSSEYEQCHTSTCQREGCTLRFTGLGSSDRIIIDCDKCDNLFAGEPTQQRPDFLIFYQESQQLTVAIVEVKSGRPKVRDAAAQIAAGAWVADKLLGCGTISKLLPILLCGGELRRADSKILQAKTITLKGQASPIRFVRCGKNFHELLSRTWYQ